MPIDPAREGGYEPIDPLENDDLSRFILAQSAEGIAVPVLLFAPEAFDDAADAGDHEAGSQEAGEQETEVQALADRLGIDLAEAKLYSTEGYLLQCGLGQRRLDTLLSERA